ncbi:MAG: CPBP family intramembrane metalloprotease [Clostridia bacterium]|nr:CPBP family intramembrane metalloprotease [Clostridia bacterium]
MENRKTYIIAPVLVIVIMALSLVLRHIDASILGEGETVFLSVAALQLVVLFLPALIYVRIRSIPIPRLRLRLPPRKSLLFILSSLVVVIAGSMLISFGMYFCGIPTSNTLTYSELIPDRLTSRTVFVSIAFAVIPALTEEFLCHSVILEEYDTLGMGGSIIMSSLIFAILHANLEAFPIYLFSGLVLGFVSYVSRSVFASMAVHLVYNLYILFFEKYISAIIKIPQNVIFVIFLTVALLLLFSFFIFAQTESILLKNGRNALDRDRDFERSGGKSPLIHAIMSPSFLVCVALYLVAVIFIR